MERTLRQNAIDTVNNLISMIIQSGIHSPSVIRRILDYVSNLEIQYPTDNEVVGLRQRLCSI